jgi:hypothetical protein
MHLVEPANGTFTKQELARLAVYRAAVAAGFYTDWDGSAPTGDREGYYTEDGLATSQTNVDATSEQSTR